MDRLIAIGSVAAITGGVLLVPDNIQQVRQLAERYLVLDVTARVGPGLWDVNADKLVTGTDVVTVARLIAVGALGRVIFVLDSNLREQVYPDVISFSLSGGADIFSATVYMGGRDSP